MQFKHPEILYILFALAIPVFIHLFQLQRFTKVSFTNVKFLKQVELQTRKSAQLKKWLVLLARLLAFTMLIIAFAQPYFSQNDTSKEWFTTIYLDNSLSMQAKGEQGELLKRAIQDIAEHLPNQGTYSLITNDEVTTDLSKDLLTERIKNTNYSAVKLDLNTLFLKTAQLFKQQENKHHKLLLFSDFQDNTSVDWGSQTPAFDFVKLEALKKNNVAIDSVFETDTSNTGRTIEIIIKNQGAAIENLTVSALHNQMLVAKSMLSIKENSSEQISLRLPKEHSNISVVLDHKDRFLFDNKYYISFKEKEKINVLLISDATSFLEKIYTADEFNLTKNNPNQVAYELFDKQELVVLDGIDVVSESLQTKVAEFVANGGSLVLIPSSQAKVEKLNQFFSALGIGQVTKRQTNPLKVTKIHYAHPVLKNVFDKQVKNFQYPSVAVNYQTILPQAQPILSFENQQPFISKVSNNKGSVYWVSAALDKKSSDFTNAPLIVPVFYNIAKQSVLQRELSYRIGQENQISIKQEIEKDAVLHIVNSDTDFIPLQKIASDKVILSLTDLPNKAGFYSVQNKAKSIQNIAFNTNREESKVSFIDMNAVAKTNINSHSFPSIKKALAQLTSQQNIQSYFKWFILLALLFLLIEMLLLKYL